MGEKHAHQLTMVEVRMYRFLTNVNTYVYTCIYVYILYVHTVGTYSTYTYIVKDSSCSKRELYMCSGTLCKLYSTMDIYAH